MNQNQIILLLIKTFGSYLFLFLLFRIISRKQLQNLTIEDLVVYFFISELLSLSFNEEQNTLWHSFIPIIVVCLLHLMISYLSLKWKKFRQITNGKVIYLIYEGKINFQNMKKQLYSLDDLYEQMHQKDYYSLKEIRFAILENNGSLSLIPYSLKKIKYPFPLIMDGKINQEGLILSSLTKEQIITIIKSLGYNQISDIFLLEVLNDDFYLIPFEKIAQEK